MNRLALLVFASLAVGAQAAGLEVSSGWIRLLPAGAPAGGYFELRNTTTTTTRLIGASSPVFGTAMLHRSVEEKGRASMMHVDTIEVPAGGKIAFRPGGYHLMLIKPVREIKVGEFVSVTLEFAGGERISERFQVYGPSGKPQ